MAETGGEAPDGVQHQMSDHRATPQGNMIQLPKILSYRIAYLFVKEDEPLPLREVDVFSALPLAV